MSTASTPRPKIAYLAVHALHDRTSGAAISLSTIMRTLATRGWECHALSAAVFDLPPPVDKLDGMLTTSGLRLRGHVRGTRSPVWQGDVEGVSHTVIRMQNMRRMVMNPLEEALFLQLARPWLAERKPDIVLTFGGLVLDGALQRCAREQGAAVVFYLANASYHNRQTFVGIDRILTNSEQTAQMYAQRLGIQAYSVGACVDTARFTATQREPKYVTFINPVGEKGVTLFLRLVAMAATRSPDMRFLVVESRGTVAAALQKTRVNPAVAARITVLPRQDDMREVYRQTRILLFPSFWFESSGRVLIEAVTNGIPVIASAHGGVPETLAGGGTLLEVPAPCLSNHWHLPSEEEAQPWWQALRALHGDPDHYDAAVQKALSAAQVHDFDAKAARVDALLQETIAIRRARAGSVAPEVEAIN